MVGEALAPVEALSAIGVAASQRLLSAPAGVPAAAAAVRSQTMLAAVVGAAVALEVLTWEISPSRSGAGGLQHHPVLGICRRMTLDFVPADWGRGK